MGTMAQVSKGLTAWPQAKPKPLWRQAEEYFKRERDKKLTVTLPRVTFQELEEEAA